MGLARLTMPHFRLLKTNENMVIGHLLSAEAHFGKLDPAYDAESDAFHNAINAAKMIILARPAIRSKEDKKP